MFCSILLLLFSHYEFSGIGHVPSIELVSATDTPHPCIQWQEPDFVSADVTNLMYNVSVGGAELSPLSITTSETRYCLNLAPCQEYNITVTPLSTSPDYAGTSNRTTDAVEGGILRK